jgi:hypothetical protein
MAKNGLAQHWRIALSTATPLCATNAPVLVCKNILKGTGAIRLRRLALRLERYAGLAQWRAEQECAGGIFHPSLPIAGFAV